VFVRRTLNGILEGFDGGLGVAGLELGYAQKTHGDRVFSVPPEGTLEKMNGLVVETENKTGSAGEKISDRGLGLYCDIVVEGGQGSGIVFYGMEGPAQKKKGFGGAFVLGDDFFQYGDGGFIIPPRSGPDGFFQLLLAFTGAPPGSGLPVKAA
jgi:hypothetical protein